MSAQNLFLSSFLVSIAIFAAPQAEAESHINRTPPRTVPAAPAARDGKNTATVAPAVHYGKIKTQADVLREFGPKLDRLKAVMEEWGTLSFAPIIFAPTITEDTAPKRPFELTESKATPTNKFSMEGLYGDYNESQGQSLFAQRTQTALKIAASNYTDELLMQQESAKQEVYRINYQRNIDADAFQRRNAELRLSEATERDRAAKQAASVAQKELDIAKAQQAAAAVTLAAATAALKVEQDRPMPVEDQVKAARETVTQAQAKQTQADAAVAAANSAKTSADATATSNATALTQAQAEFNTAAVKPIPLPTDLRATTASDLTSAVDKPDVPFGNMPSMPASPTMGVNDLPGTLRPANTGGSFSPLARINSAAAALTVKNIHSFLGNPEAATETYKDKLILFGVSSLSVNPGWRTKRDFKGTISAEVNCKMEEAHSETIREILHTDLYPIGFRKRIAASYPGALTEKQRQFFEKVEAAPLDECREYIASLPSYCETPEIMVEAVTPMVDSQNLDLASSIARQDEIALFLAASMTQAGARAVGKVFSSWSRMRRKDVATRSSLAVANSFTSGGKQFGFEIGTTLRGLDDSNAKGNKAAQTLDRQTFPVLLILGMSQDDARPRFSITASCKIKVWEPTFKADYQTMWSRTHHNFWTRFRAERKLSTGYDEVLDMGEEKASLRQAMAEFKCVEYPEAVSDAMTATMANMDREYKLVAAALYGTGIDVTLPAKWLLHGSKPQADSTVGLVDTSVSVDPTRIIFDPPSLVFEEANTVTTVVLRGNSMKSVEAANIDVLGTGIQKGPAVPLVLGDNSISVELKVTDALSGKVRFFLPHKYGGDPVETEELDFVVKSKTVPVIDPWVVANHNMVGTNEGGVWSGDLDLIMRGTNLNQLAPGATVRGHGIVTDQTVSVETAGTKAAVVKVKVRSIEGKGEAVVEFTLTDKPGVKLQSHPFTFTFKQSQPPSISPWKLEEYVGTGTEKAAKWSGKIEMLVAGTNLLSLVHTAKLGGVKETAKVIFEPIANDLARVEIEFSDVVPPAGPTILAGQAYLEFSPAASQGGKPLFSAPFKYRLVK